MTLTNTIINCATGEVTEVPLTSEELAQRMDDLAQYAKAT